MGPELAFRSVAEIAPLLQSGAISPVDLVSETLERTGAYDRALGAFLTLTPERAMEAAVHAEAEIRRGEYRGPFHGVPIANKDVVWSAGVPMSAHSRALATFVPSEDAAVVSRLRDAGAVPLGQANCHELACGAMETYRIARNPWDPRRATGGSSSGSAAAVAAHMAFAATGTDTGGSIRVPASFSGLVGLKPTFGRVSCHGVLPISYTFDTVGVLTKRVEDAALMLGAIAGHDARDPTSAARPAPDFAERLGEGLRGVRLGVPQGSFQGDLDPEVAAAFDEALRALDGAGAEVVPVEVPLADLGSRLHAAIWLAEAAVALRAFVEERPSEVGRVVLNRVRQGFYLSADDYLVAMQARARLVADTGRLMDDVDALVCPTTAIPAYEIDDLERARSDVGRLARLANLTGLPAISVPCGFTSGGMPIGLQVIGRAWDEASVLRIAHAYERATPWHEARAPYATQALREAPELDVGTPLPPLSHEAIATRDWVLDHAATKRLGLTPDDVDAVARQLQPLLLALARVRELVGAGSGVATVFRVG